MSVLKKHFRITVLAAIFPVIALAGCTRTSKINADAVPEQDSVDRSLALPPDSVQRADAPTPEGEKQLKQNLKQAEATMEAMTLTPTATPTADGVLFQLTAKRNHANGKEWMPSSENFRVIIVSAKGGEIWNSSNGMNYLTVVGEVKPAKIGATEKYEMLWPGITNSKQPAPPGTYTAQLMIPARPLPYQANVEFEWKGK